MKDKNVTAARKMVVRKIVEWDTKTGPDVGVEDKSIQPGHLGKKLSSNLLFLAANIALAEVTYFFYWAKRRILRFRVVNFFAEHKNWFWHGQFSQLMLSKQNQLAMQTHAKMLSRRNTAMHFFFSLIIIFIGVSLSRTNTAMQVLSKSKTAMQKSLV